MSNLTISQTGVNLIKSFEGLRLTPYNPTGKEKYLTIGYGHYGSDVTPGMKLTEQQAEDLLRKDVQRYIDGVNTAIKTNVNQNQFDAMVSLCYNIGISAFSRSDLAKYFNEGHLEEASAEFDLWIHGSGRVLPGLVSRRNKEQALFNTPVAKPVPKAVVTPETYTIHPGDNLTHIAEDFNLTVDFLVKLNGIDNPNHIQVGQVLRLKEKPKPQPVKPLIKHANGDSELPLSMGSHGHLVGNVQRFLGLKDDESFGPNTRDAVKRYQKMRGLAVDGIVGKQTYSQMFGK